MPAQVAQVARVGNPLREQFMLVSRRIMLADPSSPADVSYWWPSSYWRWPWSSVSYGSRTVPFNSPVFVKSTAALEALNVTGFDIPVD